MCLEGFYHPPHDINWDDLQDYGPAYRAGTHYCWGQRLYDNPFDEFDYWVRLGKHAGVTRLAEFVLGHCSSIVVYRVLHGNNRAGVTRLLADIARRYEYEVKITDN